MYTYVMPRLAAERARDIRNDALAASRIRLVRRAHASHRPGPATAPAPGHQARPVPATARP